MSVVSFSFSWVYTGHNIHSNNNKTRAYKQKDCIRNKWGFKPGVDPVPHRGLALQPIIEAK
jgi:hypothetical protein